MKLLKIIGCSVALMMTGSAIAESVKMFTDRAPSAKEMGNIIFSQPVRTKSAGIKKRSINFSPVKRVPQELPEQAKAHASDTAVGLPIKFAFNSSTVLNESKPFLNEIGKMLALPDYLNERLIIEGHTDASGPESYNQSLSEQRAQAVKNYLRGHFNVDSNRLLVTGLGESQSLENTNPYASVNRRVQFRKAP